jgi:DNA polymerase-3 subunit delta
MTFPKLFFARVCSSGRISALHGAAVCGNGGRVMGPRTPGSPVDDLLRLRGELKSGRLPPVFLFHMKPGERDRDSVEFLASKLVEIIVSQMRSDPGAKFNIDIFDAAEAAVGHVLTVARTAPMFGDRRLTVLRGSSGIKEEDADRIASYIKDPPRTATLVLSLLSSKIPERLIKAAAGGGYAHRLEAIGERSLAKWIRGVFAEEGAAITADAVAAIAQLVGCNLQAIEDARDKLVLYTMGKGTIDAGDVEELLLRSRSADIFELADALWDRNPARAMMVLAQLESQKTDAIFINTVLAQQLRSLVKVKSITAGGRADVSQVASALDIREFLARKYLAASRRFTLRELEEALGICARMNAELKSSRMDAYRIIEKACLAMLSLGS